MKNKPMKTSWPETGYSEIYLLFLALKKFCLHFAKHFLTFLQRQCHCHISNGFVHTQNIIFFK